MAFGKKKGGEPAVTDLGKKKDKEKKGKLKASSLIYAIVSFVIAIGLFVGLINLESYFSEEIAYNQVVVAKTDIPKGTILTMENAAGYLEVKKVAAFDVFDGSLETADVLVGKKSLVEIKAGEIVSDKDFQESSVLTALYEDPIEVSVAIGSIADMDGGKIRQGDIVNLTMLYTKDQLSGDSEGETATLAPVPTVVEPVPVVEDEATEETGEDGEEKAEGEDAEEADTDGTEEAEVTEDESTEVVETPAEEAAAPVVADGGIYVGGVSLTGGETAGQAGYISGYTDSAYNYNNYSQYVFENLYISKVLDSSGVEIASSDTVSNASILVFTIEKREELVFNNAIANCSGMRVSKVLNIDKLLADARAKFEKADADLPKEGANASEGEQSSEPEEAAHK